MTSSIIIGIYHLEERVLRSDCNWTWRAVWMLSGELLTAAAEWSFCKLKFNNVNVILSLTLKPNRYSSVSFGVWLPLVPCKKHSNRGYLKQPRLDQIIAIRRLLSLKNLLTYEIQPSKSLEKKKLLFSFFMYLINKLCYQLKLFYLHSNVTETLDFSLHFFNLTFKKIYILNILFISRCLNPRWSMWSQCEFEVMFLFSKAVSYAYKGCIYLIKISNIVKYY